MDIVGIVTHISQVATRDIDPRVARVAPNGLVPINSSTGEVIDPFIEIRLTLPDSGTEFVGSELKTKVPSKPTTIAKILERRIKRFLNKVK